eukprot:scaffold176390_cov30-Tisochrysis_lutea.AAC.2
MMRMCSPNAEDRARHLKKVPGGGGGGGGSSMIKGSKRSGPDHLGAAIADASLASFRRLLGEIAGGTPSSVALKFASHSSRTTATPPSEPSATVCSRLFRSGMPRRASASGEGGASESASSATRREMGGTVKVTSRRNCSREDIKRPEVMTLAPASESGVRRASISSDELTKPKDAETVTRRGPAGVRRRLPIERRPVTLRPDALKVAVARFAGA